MKQKKLAKEINNAPIVNNVQTSRGDEYKNEFKLKAKADEHGIIHQDGYRFVRDDTGIIRHLPKWHPDNINPFQWDYVIQRPFKRVKYRTESGKLAYRLLDANGVGINQKGEVNLRNYRKLTSFKALYKTMFRSNDPAIPKPPKNSERVWRLLMANIKTAVPDEFYGEFFDEKGNPKYEAAAKMLHQIVQYIQQSPEYVAAFAQETMKDALKHPVQWAEKMEQLTAKAQPQNQFNIMTDKINLAPKIVIQGLDEDEDDEQTKIIDSQVIEKTGDGQES